MLRRMKTKEHASSGATVYLELRLEFAEQQLMTQFNEFTKTFSSRNVILVYKAKRSVHSHAERTKQKNNRRLAIRRGVYVTVQGMYLTTPQPHTAP